MPELTLEELAAQVDWLRCAALEAFTRGHSAYGDRLDEAAAEAEHILAKLQRRRREGQAIAEMYGRIGDGGTDGLFGPEPTVRGQYGRVGGDVGAFA